MLKGNNFAINKDDEADFAQFMARLKERRLKESESSPEKPESENRASPFQADHSKIESPPKKKVKFEEPSDASEVTQQINKVLQDSPLSQVSQQNRLRLRQPRDDDDPSTRYQEIIKYLDTVDDAVSQHSHSQSTLRSVKP